MTQSRLSGLIVAGFGLILLLVLIPYGTERVDYGWLRPSGLPSALAWVLILSGLWAAWENAGTRADAGQLLRALGLLGFFAVELWLIGRIGFMIAAPVMTLALMLLVGERRPGWLALGALGVPSAIWLTVSQLLDRPLP
ncbi:tripartite tricarboxylate transporter TctB family protein [Pukyongiella litopenaei]|uniref:DUF1468 domain-containing protein n=1 Tax=Pukyongiella litopenaei TaxID=2605946 RepID=A0A2S0MR43_9RHOB|nr:tripartite tricarboxylate transporter TctB family protein [Pukyongiella litopenaei]AVO38163.1 hypothetical protein C6Y53_10900 [Pukyongiella litopenaei]